MLDRRQFVAAGAAALSTVHAGCSNTVGFGGGGGETVGTGTHRAPLPALGATVALNGIGLGGQGIAATLLTATSVVAVSRQCTHQGCTIDLPAAIGQGMQCPCHGSIYTTSGAVIQGPSGGPLQTYPATIDPATNELVVTIA